MSRDDFSNAVVNRSLRSIKTELEFLADTSIITTDQLSLILSQLPLHETAAVPSVKLPVGNSLPVRNGHSNGYNEKQGYFAPSPEPAVQTQSPPAYPITPQNQLPSALAHATALYAYQPTDAGDLRLEPNERVIVTEYMNSEWWKGRSEKTGAEGIFPRSYVRAEDNNPGPTNYGNMPLDVSQSGGVAAGQGSKMQGQGAEMGKKFGKKLGNAAIFGAGATIGSNIVNGIL